MNKYLIKYKIATVAELEDTFKLNDYEFTPFTKEYWSCNAWVATKMVEADHGGIALRDFILGLIPIIEQCSVIPQCAFRIVANTYIVYKLNNNPDKAIYIYYVRKVSHTGLPFGKREYGELLKMESIQNKKWPLFIMEASNASTFYTRLSMLLSAVEGLAGEVRMQSQVMTDKKNLEIILGTELFHKLYDYKTGLRHKLSHGNINSHDLFEGLTDEVYKKIINYITNKFSIQFEENVVHPQRNFSDNYEAARTFEKIKDEKYIDLKLIEDAFDDSNPKHHDVEQLIFNGYIKGPANY